MSYPKFRVGGSILTADDHDANLRISTSVISFNAKGNAAASRPSVPADTVVIWINVPSEPADMGEFDLWLDEGR